MFVPVAPASFVFDGSMAVPRGTTFCVAIEHIAPESHSVRTWVAEGVPIFVRDMK